MAGGWCACVFLWLGTEGDRLCLGEEVGKVGVLEEGFWSDCRCLLGARLVPCVVFAGTNRLFLSGGGMRKVVWEEGSRALLFGIEPHVQ